MPKGDNDDFIVVWEAVPYEDPHSTLRNVMSTVETELEEISLRKENEMGPSVRQRVNVIRRSAVPNVREAVWKELTLIESHLPELLRLVLAETTSEEE